MATLQTLFAGLPNVLVALIGASATIYAARLSFGAKTYEARIGQAAKERDEALKRAADAERLLGDERSRSAWLLDQLTQRDRAKP